MTLSPITEIGYDAWRRLWDGYLDFYKATLPAEVSTLTWQRLSDPLFNITGFAALEGGQAVGIVHCIFHPSSWTRGEYCYLQDLFVDPGCRGKGIGRALIEAVVTLAKSRGVSRVYWLTQEDNQEARRLYDQVASYAGFIQYRINL